MKHFAKCLITFLLATALQASIPADSLGEGTCVGYVPSPADTVSDTTFHVGDTLFLSNGEISIKIADSLKEEVVIPSIRTIVKAVISDGFAHGKVTQVFTNPFNLPFDATYVFPLPHDGAIHDMEFKTSFGIYHADLMKKEEAQVIFDSANAQGMQASLLTQVQDGIFVQNICNIPAHDSVKVTITFSSVVPYDMQKFDFNFPATIAEDRYGDNPLDPIVSFPHERPGTSLEFYILVMAPYDISGLSCPTYDVDIQQPITVETAINYGLLEFGDVFPKAVSASLILLKSKQTIPNNDIAIRFNRVEVERDVSLLSHNDGKDGYFAMQIYPNMHDTGQVQSIDIVFVIDKSGSMGGNPIALARETVHQMLNKTRPTDRISLLAFDNTQYALFPTPEPATEENVLQAHAWIDNLNAGGGTEMLAGVQKALATPIAPEKKRIIALITDGEIYGVDQMYAAIKNDTSDNTVFAFAIGARTNQELIDGATEAGGGIGKHIVDINDMVPTVSDFWKRIRIPQISDLTIDWGSSDIPTGIVGSDMSNLWFGAPIKVFGQYKTGGPRTITLNGQSNGTSVSESYDVGFVTQNTALDMVSKMWAREIIEYWMHEQIAQGNEMNKNKILEISLAHNVLCKYTAFLAVADSIYDESIGQWVSAEEYFANNNNNNNNNNDTNNVTGMISDAELINVKPALAMQHLGHTVRMTLRGIPKTHTNGYVNIYDLKGRLIMRWSIAELAKKNFNWSWNMTDLYGNAIAKGFYVLSVQNSFFKTSKRLLIK